MFRFVVLSVVVAVAAASICCVPPQWEGQMSSLIGASDTHEHGAYMTVIDNIAYDAVSHKIGIYENIRINDKPSSYGILLDYNTDSRYVFDVDSGKCLKTRLGRTVSDFGGCIPSDATVVATDVLVGYGSNDAKVNVSRMTYPNATVDISVTSDACVPVQEIARGSLKGNNFLQYNFYFNITAGLSADTVNNLASPPKGCENAPTVEAHYAQTFVGKRSALGFLGL